MANLTFTLIDNVTTIHDETNGLQNTPPTLDATTNDNGNDIAVGSLPSLFSNRLTALGADPTGALGAALSGYDGSNAGSNVFTIDSGGLAIDNLAFTDVNGDLLNGLDSGLTTVDEGNSIFLYTDPTNDNIVLGREGMGATADPNGDLVFAIYLDESPDLTAGKIWTVQYEALVHDDPGDGSNGTHDEPLDLTDKLFVTASRDLEFNLNNAPSGQNLFIQFGDGIITDGDSEVGIIATGKNPANVSEGEGLTSGDTVNTSQAGGPTTFGVNNQQINEGQGIYFTFVTGPNPDFTVPNLTQTEADLESNIQFNDFLGAKGAEFDVVQLQSGKTAVVKISAFNETETAANASGDNFVDELNNDTHVSITSVEVFDADNGGEINIIDNGDGTFTIEGVEAGDRIQYFTEGNHNRVLIENAGDGKGKDSADFDIGGFQLLQADTATQEVGSTVYWEDDGPSITVDMVGEPAMLMVDETDLTVDASANFADNFSSTPDFGADGAGMVTTSYSLGGFTDGMDSGLDDTATGDDVLLVLNGGVVEGRLADDTVVFSVSIDANGTVTLDQQRAVGHPDITDPNDAASLAADLISLTRTDTISDGDGDTAMDNAIIDLGPALTFKDDGPAITVEAVVEADMLMVDETDLTVDASANFADNFSSTPDFGADGAGMVNTSYSLGGFTDGMDSGLDDTATGNDVLLFLNGGVVEGRLADDTVVFSVSVDANGTVTLDQQRAVVHPDITDPNDALSLAADLIRLTRTDTISDGDGDTSMDNAIIDLGPALTFKDDGPALEFGNLVGTGTENAQTGFWSESVGADQPGTLSITANSTFDIVAPDGSITAGILSGFNESFDGTSGTGRLTGDFGTGEQSVDFTLTVNPDGTYEFDLAEGFGSEVTLSSADGQLPAGGPDPVQTLIVGDTDIVFFATDPLAPQTGDNSITEAIALGEPDLTEAELQSRSAMADSDGNGTPGTGEFSFISDNQLMNVSTSGIGVDNNVLQGGDNDPAITAGDESFVVNTEPLLTSVKVFIDNSVGGYDPGPESLYYTIYDETGNATGPILVEEDDLSPEAGGQVSFQIEWDGVNLIDAVQLTMGEGAIKIPVIEFTTQNIALANDILLNFDATLVDSDGDTANTSFGVSLIGNDINGDFDYILSGDAGSSEAFNADEAGVGSQYLVQNFDVLQDELVLLNLADGYNLDTSMDQGVGTSAPDSFITSNNGLLTVIVEDSILTEDNITSFSI